MLALRGRNPLGYYKDDEKSASTFQEIDGIRYSVPGDFATVDADGAIALLGRGSVVINTGGEKVFPEEVEEVLKRHPAVRDAVAVGIPDERFGEVVAAVVELRPGAEAGEADFIDHVRRPSGRLQGPQAGALRRRASGVRRRARSTTPGTAPRRRPGRPPRGEGPRPGGGPATSGAPARRGRPVTGPPPAHPVAPASPGASSTPALDLVAHWPVEATAGVVRVAGGGPGPRPPTGAGPAPDRLPEVAALVGDVGRVLPWASVTKLLVALAVLVAVEEGTVDLGEPAGPPGSTVRHLLAHASGLAPDERRALTAPGRRRIYSNAGYEVLAEVLEADAGMPFTEYLGAAVVAPLGLTATTLAPGASPASGGRRSARRPARGRRASSWRPSWWRRPRWRVATAVAFPGLAGVLPGFGRFDPCDWGLGFELRDAKDPHWTGPAQLARHLRPLRTVRQLPVGRSGGRAWRVRALGDGAFGPWAARAWPRLADAVLDEFAPAPDGPGPVA